MNARYDRIDLHQTKDIQLPHRGQHEGNIVLHPSSKFRDLGIQPNDYLERCRALGVAAAWIPVGRPPIDRMKLASISSILDSVPGRILLQGPQAPYTAAALMCSEGMRPAAAIQRVHSQHPHILKIEERRSLHLTASPVGRLVYGIGYRLYRLVKR